MPKLGASWLFPNRRAAFQPFEAARAKKWPTLAPTRGTHTVAFFGPLHGLGVEKCELLPNGTLRGRISLPDGRMPADSCGADGIPEGITLFAFSPKRASRVGITEKGKQWATQTNGGIASARNKPLQPHKQLQRKPLHRFASVSRKNDHWTAMVCGQEHCTNHCVATR